MEVEQPLDVLPRQAFARGMSLQVLRVLESWATMPRLPRLAAALMPAAERLREQRLPACAIRRYQVKYWQLLFAWHAAQHAAARSAGSRGSAGPT